eukprot:gene45595-30363_t
MRVYGIDSGWSLNVIVLHSTACVVVGVSGTERYDVSAATRALESDGAAGLPVEMRDAYLDLIKNLL